MVVSRLAVVGGLQDAGGLGDRELVVGQRLRRAGLRGLGIEDQHALAEHEEQQQRDGSGVEPRRHQVE
ncbi:hypothetical protein D3C85_1855430 [compost metagenome]